MSSPRWIPAEERLPENETPVLCTDGDTTFVGMYCDDSSIWVMLFGFLPASGVDVTHWQYLPDPPHTLN